MPAAAPERELVAPAFHWVPPHTHTRGPEVADLAASVDFALDAEQRLVVDSFLATNGSGETVARTAVVVACRQNLKALAWDTEILTDRGWLTMADVKVGDEVFHPSGARTVVTGASDVMLGHECFRVTTTDGRSVVADGGHLWTVVDKRRSRGGRFVVRTLTTRDMVEAGLSRCTSGSRRTTVTAGKSYETNEFRFSLPVQEPLRTDDVLLPVDPYLFGAWLGDGASNGAHLTCHVDDVAHWMATVRAAGFVPTVRFPPDRAATVGVTTEPGVGRQSRSFLGKLRRLGVLGAKRIPEEYLTAGTGQRLALLQGLLDTDGTVALRRGQVTFCSTNRDLADGVLFLTRSLGWRSTLRESRALLDGRDCGPKFDVMFTPVQTDEFCPFRLPRKIERVKAADGGKGRRTVSIARIETVDPVPVRCIRVAADDGLFLAGRDLVVTHNTAALEMLALDDLFLAEPDLNVWTSHRTDAMAETFLRMKALVDNFDHLRRRTRKVTLSPGEQEIEALSGARLKFQARSTGAGRALSARVLYYDEGFALTPAHVGASVPILSTRRWAQVRVGSSAGRRDSDVLRGWRNVGREKRPSSMVYLEWCAPEGGCTTVDCDHAYGRDGCVLDDRGRWLAANPAMGRRITPEAIQSERETMPPLEFARERLGWWEDPATAGVDLDPVAWAAAGDPDATPGAPLRLAVDADQGLRSAAVVACGPGGDGVPVVEVVEHRRGAAWLAARVAELVERHCPGQPVGLDPAGPAGALILELEKAGVGVEPVDARSMAQACGGLVAAVTAGRLRHRDEAALNTAVEGAARRDVGDGAWKWSRRDSRADVAPLVAATVAVHLVAGNTPAADYDVLESVH